MKLFEATDDGYSNEDVGLVLFNHYGSSAAQDTGRDAKYISETFDIHVLAVDRPGTGRLLPSPALAKNLSSRVGFADEISDLGKEIDLIMCDLGVEKVIAAGRSAGALGALALAATERVAGLKAVYAAEAIGWQYLSLDKGREAYAEYMKQQTEILKNSSVEEIVKPQPPGLNIVEAIGRLASIPPAMLIDRYHNQKLFTTDAARFFATLIASERPWIDATLDFAQYSLAAAPDLYEREVMPLADLRDSFSQPFIVRRPSGTVHSSFDNRDFFNESISPTISRTLER